MHDFQVQRIHLLIPYENCTFLTDIRNSNEQSGQGLSWQPNHVSEIEIIPTLGKLARETNEATVIEIIKHLNF